MTNNIPVKIKKTHPHAIVPHFATEGSAGFDLSTCEDAFIYPEELERVSTGLVIATPPGYMLYLTFRSSTPKKYGITVLTGVVDSDYCGDEDVISLQVYNISGRLVKLPSRSRIAQGIFVPIQNKIDFVEVEDMGESRGGFGSTG